MSGRRVASTLLALALAVFVILGGIDGSLGVAWPSIRTELDRGISDLGLILAAASAGYLIASMGFGSIHSRLGTAGALIAGGALLMAGTAGYALSPTWSLLALSAAVAGLGGGLVDTGMNHHAALEFDVGSINLLHAAYGIGATAGPLLITASLTMSGTWRGGYGALAATQLVVLLAIWRGRHGWSTERERSGDDLASPRRVLLLLYLVPFLMYTGVEVATGQWAFSLLHEYRGLTTSAAGAWVAAYWGALTAGRLLFGFVGDRVNAVVTLRVSLVTAIIGALLLWWAPVAEGAIGLPVAGLGFAVVFPTLVSLTPGRMGRGRSARMMGYQLAAANIGAATIPWALGLLAEAKGLAILAPGLFVAAVLLLAVVLATSRPASPSR